MKKYKVSQINYDQTKLEVIMYFIVNMYYIEQILSAKFTLGSDAHPTRLDV